MLLSACVLSAAFLTRGTRGPVSSEVVEISTIFAADPKEPPLSGTGFAENAVFPTTHAPVHRGSLQLYGSWLHTDTSLGRAHTSWYPAVREFYLFVAGYPNKPGNQLFAEVSNGSPDYVRVPILRSENPGESWRLASVSLAEVPGATRFRIVGVDGSVALAGWLGFSLPFAVRADNAYLLRQMLIVFLAAVAATLFLLAPGLVLRQKRRVAFVWVPFPGLLGLALVGLVAWIAPNSVKPVWTSRIALWAIVLYSSYRFWRLPINEYTDSLERRTLLIIALLVAIGTAKASYSLGPAGELFRGTISRTLEVGAVSDSRLSFHVVQLIAFQKKPFSDFGKALYSHYGGWNFSHRGAIASLTVAPIVLSSPVSISAAMPNENWTIYDAQGYAAYRIAMIVVAACSLLTVFGLAKLFLPDNWAFFAFLVTVSAPFVVHEIYFTWPKLEDTAFILLAAYLIFRRRYFLSGFAAGLGYLCHPSALLAVPSLAGLAVLQQSSNSDAKPFFRRASVWTGRLAAMLGGVAVWLLIWRLINRKHYSQGQFLLYFLTADGPAINFGHWLKDRFDSFCNTIIPLNVFLFHSDRPGLNSVEGPSPPLIHFNFQYWDAIPFGAGIGYFFCLVRQCYVSWFKARAWLLLVFVLPFLFYTIYWGSDNTGMLRTGLHPWFVGLMIASVVIWQRFLSHSQGFWNFAGWALLSRIIGLIFILLIPSIAAHHALYTDRFALSDIVCVLVMSAGAIWLCAYTFAWSEELRKLAGSRVAGQVGPAANGPSSRSDSH